MTENDLLSDSAKIRMVFVDGVRSDVAPPPASSRRAAAGDSGTTNSPVTQIAGTWQMVVNTPQGANTSTLTITQDGNTIRGAMVSELGRMEIADGRIEGRRVTWSATLTMGGETIPLSFDGMIEGDRGDRMAGSVGLGPMGSAEFTARKTP